VSTASPYLTGQHTPAQPLRHEPVLEIAEAGALREMVLGQEQIPKPELLGFGLELLDDGRVGREALLGPGPELGLEDGVGRDAFFLDKLLYHVQRLLGPVADKVSSQDGDSVGCFFERHFYFLSLLFLFWAREVVDGVL
jgi:hypothetical protein